MVQLIFLVLVGATLYYGMQYFADANPVKVARLLRRIGGIAALSLAIVLLLRGRLDVALVSAGVGAWLLGWSAGPDWRSMLSHPSTVFSGHRFVRTLRCEIELTAQGELQGGRLISTGRAWDAMACDDLVELYQLCGADDDEAARWLEIYLDRRFPQWRAAGQTYADTGRGHHDRAGHRQAGLTEQEAYEVLGLARGAGVDEIIAAHRALIKKLHPDHGGTTSLAARINEAKDVLISRHR